MLIRRGQYSAYDFKKGCSQPEQEISSLWPELTNAGILKIDASLDFFGLADPDSQDLSGKCYFFNENRCTLMDGLIRKIQLSIL